MQPLPHKPASRGDPILDFVRTALDQDELSGVSEVLKSIALAVDGYGCILWQETPPTSPHKDRLFVLAHWFRDDTIFATHDLPLDGSVTGEAVLTGRTRNVRDVKKGPVFWDRFMKETQIRVFCSVPITFVDDARGAVNLYRNVLQPFSANEVAQIERLASLVPRLYQTIRNTVSFNLLSRVNETLHEADHRSPGKRPLSKIEVQDVFHEICERVSASFQCLETSVFLEDRLETPGRFELMATTWPASFPFKKTSYHRDAAEGATGWVLEKVQPVKLFDLARFDKESAGRDYPGLVWRDSLDIKSTVRALLSKGPDEELAPLSFMAAPIHWSEVVYGAIRCSVVKQGSFYFAERELRLLESVAAQIGRYWSNWLSRQELQQDLASLQALVRSVGELNRFVHTELMQPVPDEGRILREALRVTSRVIRGAEITDVRLLDTEKKELYFAAIHGREWTEDPRQLRFPVDDSESSAGAHVVRTGETYVVNDIKNDPHYFPTFANTRRLIVVPLSVEMEGSGEPEVSGVLDIRSTFDRDFSDSAVPIATLLGRQLALYRFLTQVINDLNAAVTRQEKLKEQQIQIFQDMDHQFKSPILQAHARVESILRQVEDDELRQQLLAIRGLCAKAKRVSMNSGLFASLARREPIKVAKESWTGSDLVKLLIEAAQDNRLMVGPRRNINFHVETEGFKQVEAVKLDKNLLEQAVTNVLDNAFKYSYRQTHVVISGGYTKTKRFFISVVNEGISILPGEPLKCVMHGWQSEAAKAASEAGSGIGLWIVHHIMQVHGGDLIIKPTRDRKTEVRLVFPVE